MRIAIYARVSTQRQDCEMQLLPLRAHAATRGWEVVEEFVDQGFSGAKDRRPALDRLMKAAWAGEFQAALVWRFDRFARSTKHLLSALDTFRSLNINFISIQEQFDTSTPIGQAMFTIIGAMAQLERDIIRERVKAGLSRARACGTRLGRPALAIDQQELRQLHTQGLTIRAIAKRMGTSPTYVFKALRNGGRDRRMVPTDAKSISE